MATALDPRFRLIVSEKQVATAKQEMLAKLAEIGVTRRGSPMDHGGESSTGNRSSNGEQAEPPLKRFKHHLSAIVRERKKAKKRKVNAHQFLKLWK